MPFGPAAAEQAIAETNLLSDVALHTAFVAPPRSFGMTDQDGAIAPGRRADLMLLNGDPLAGLATLRRQRAVIVGGRVLDRLDLDELNARLAARGE